MKIAAIGVGNMGGAVARNLARNGIVVTAFDLNAAAVDRCRDVGVIGVESAQEAARDADVVLTSLPTTALVESVATEVLGEMREHAILVDISTINPETARKVENAAKDSGKRFVSCALGKTPEHAEHGEIPLFVGGDKGVIEELKALLEIMGNEVFIFADAAGATGFKLISNLVGMSNLVVLTEGLALARALKIDDDLFSQALSSTGAVSFQSEVRLPWLLAEDWAARFTVDLAAKDVGLAVGAAESVGLKTPTAHAALAQLNEASARGFGSEDAIAVAKVVDSRSSEDV